MVFWLLLEYFGHLDVGLARDELRDHLLLRGFGRIGSEYWVDAACRWFDLVFARVYPVDFRLCYQYFFSAFSSAEARLY